MPTHLRGAQALPAAGAEHEALFAGDGALHVPRAIRGAVHAGGVSNRGLRAASRPCTGTVGTATEKKRDGVSQQTPGVVQQRGGSPGGTCMGCPAGHGWVQRCVPIPQPLLLPGLAFQR